MVVEKRENDRRTCIVNGTMKKGKYKGKKGRCRGGGPHAEHPNKTDYQINIWLSKNQ